MRILNKCQKFCLLPSHTPTHTHTQTGKRPRSPTRTRFNLDSLEHTGTHTNTLSVSYAHRKRRVQTEIMREEFAAGGCSKIKLRVTSLRSPFLGINELCDVEHDGSVPES